MRQLSGGTFTRGFALAILGVGGVVGFVAFSSAPFAQTAQPTSAQPTPAQLSAAQTVAYRFPPNWHTAAANTSATARAESAAAAPARAGAAPARPAAPAARELPRESERQALASLMFNPGATYDLASVSSTPVALPTLTDRTMAYADPSADSVAEPHATETRATPAPTPERTASVKPQDKHSGTNVAKQKPTDKVLNDAQITSIKSRLKLTPDQQRYWPGVEAALRNITYKKDGSRSGKMAAVDPNSPAVQQLKSAAIPLIMSFSDAQKDEVRQLARLMGLEQVAASF
jgi:hypothetical protein